ncbi:hypothetical protein CIB48_g2200 [Xylaria polymorpha]|nr:hypothetical protein CIB48_g2200 [Xylaria polymorpha]
MVFIFDTQNYGSMSVMDCKHTETKSASMYLRKIGPGLFARYDDYRSSTNTVNELDMHSDKDDIEKKVGIVKHVNYAEGDIPIGSETARTILKTSAGSLTATANIKLVSKNGKPRFELKLEFEM